MLEFLSKPSVTCIPDTGQIVIRKGGIQILTLYSFASFLQIPETRIDVEVPKITTNLGKELHFVKLPNFLSIDCRPFDAETYEDEIEDEDSLDEEGRARLKLKVENTIRWRQSFDAEGKSLRESNAKFIR